MYYKNQVPNLFYELKYHFTIYDQFIYDALVATISPFTIYSHTIFPAPTIFLPKVHKQSRCSEILIDLLFLSLTSLSG